MALLCIIVTYLLWAKLNTITFLAFSSNGGTSSSWLWLKSCKNKIISIIISSLPTQSCYFMSCHLPLDKIESNLIQCRNVHVMMVLYEEFLCFMPIRISNDNQCQLSMFWQFYNSEKLHALWNWADADATFLCL